MNKKENDGLVTEKVEETRKKSDIIKKQMQEDVHFPDPPSHFSDQCLMERQSYFLHNRSRRQHRGNYRGRYFKNTARREINNDQDPLSNREETKVDLNLQMIEKEKKEYKFGKTAHEPTDQRLAGQLKTMSGYHRRDVETSSHKFTNAERTSKSDSQEKGENWRLRRNRRSWRGGTVVANRKEQRGTERGRQPSWGPRRGGRGFFRQRGYYSSFGKFMLATDPDIEDENDVAPTRNRSVRVNQDMTITVEVKNELSTTGVNVSQITPPRISSKSSEQRMQKKPPKKPVTYVSTKQKPDSSLHNESKKPEGGKCSVETELSDTFKTKINLTENQDSKSSSSSATDQTTNGKNAAVSSNHNCVKSESNNFISPKQNATDFKDDSTTVKSGLVETDKAPVEGESCKIKMNINLSTTESEGDDEGHDDSWEDMTSGPESLELSGISFNKVEVDDHRLKSKEERSCCTKKGIEENVNTIEKP